MGKIKMSIELLDVICSVLDYRRFILSNQRIVNKENFDYFTETENYFKTLPLPEGMKHNRNTFVIYCSHITCCTKKAFWFMKSISINSS